MITSNEIKTRTQIAQEYGITDKTLRNRLKRENLNLPRGFLSPKSVEKIYEKLGKPAT